MQVCVIKKALYDFNLINYFNYIDYIIPTGILFRLIEGINDNNGMKRHLAFCDHL